MARSTRAVLSMLGVCGAVALSAGVGAASPAEAQPAPTGLDATGALAFIDRNGDGLKQDDEPFFSGLELDVIGTGWSNDTAGTTTQFTDAPWVRLTTQTD